MSNAIWGDPEPQAEEAYPLALLKHLLQQMITQFAANGACLALLDERLGQMVVQLHVRPQSANSSALRNTTPSRMLGRRTTVELNPTPAATGVSRGVSLPPPWELEKPEEQSELFPLGMPYPIGQDLIGYVWRKREAYLIRHEDYIAAFHLSRTTPLQTDITPACYLVAPIQESTFIDNFQGGRERMLSGTQWSQHSEGSGGQKHHASVLGVVVLYQTTPGPGFQPGQRTEVLDFTERMALYIQNNHLRCSQRRSSDYMKRLQQISTAFPSSVRVVDLLEDIYRFITNIVDVSSMLITLYDRDRDRIYDVFAVCDGQRVEQLSLDPVAPAARPQWWRIIQEESHKLLLDLSDPESSQDGNYEELLTGVWGDQRKAKSFLLLPMKMFTRTIGSLSLASLRTSAYRPEEIMVLETMAQIITVSIENAKLYDKASESLRVARQRAESLAAMNSALQAVSSDLNLSEILHNLVKFAAKLVQAEMTTFFQLSSDGTELTAEAIHAPGGHWMDWMEPPGPGENTAVLADRLSEARTQFVGGLYKEGEHHDLIELIRLPLKGSILEHLVDSFHFYLEPADIEALAQVSVEGGAIFLRETHTTKLLMIPVRYQQELLGVLAIHTLKQPRVFLPKEVGTLLAICSQAATAIRNAQLFEEIQGANAELQRMNMLKDEFIVTASHELRTPLSAIKGYTSMLQRKQGRITPEQTLRYITKIATSTQQLSYLVATMTEAAKMGAEDKKLELQMESVQLSMAVEVAVHMLSVNSEQKITMHIPPELWVCCDAPHLRQVLTNLLDNAAKYSPPEGRITLEASATTLAQLSVLESQIDYESLAEGGSGKGAYVGAQRSGADIASGAGDLPIVVVHVHDEGEGILPGDQQKIFEKFVRASRSITTPIRGSGLGLYICRRYIEAMGGKLWLEQSIPGQGSTFSFYLPRIDAPVGVEEPEELAYQTTSGL